MKLRKNQSGFSAVELVVVLVVVAAVAFIGYGIYSNHTNKVTNNNTPAYTPLNTSSTVSTAPAVTSASGLDQALQTLNQNDPSTANASDSNQLNSQLSGF